MTESVVLTLLWLMFVPGQNHSALGYTQVALCYFFFFFFTNVMKCFACQHHTVDKMKNDTFIYLKYTGDVSYHLLCYTVPIVATVQAHKL